MGWKTLADTKSITHYKYSFYPRAIQNGTNIQWNRCNMKIVYFPKLEEYLITESTLETYNCLNHIIQFLKIP